MCSGAVVHFNSPQAKYDNCRDKKKRKEKKEREAVLRVTTDVYVIVVVFEVCREVKLRCGCDQRLNIRQQGSAREIYILQDDLHLENILGNV